MLGMHRCEMETFSSCVNFVKDSFTYIKGLFIYNSGSKRFMLLQHTYFNNVNDHIHSYILYYNLKHYYIMYYVLFQILQFFFFFFPNVCIIKRMLEYTLKRVSVLCIFCISYIKYISVAALHTDTSHLYPYIVEA